jgi:hypothetical protein
MPDDITYGGRIAGSMAPPGLSGMEDYLTHSITIHMDGGAAEPSTGVKARWTVSYDTTILGWTLIADAAGDAVIDVKRASYADFPTTASIAGTDKPTLATAQKNRNLALSAWSSVLLIAGDVIEFNLESVTTCKILDLTLNLVIVQ